MRSRVILGIALVLMLAGSALAQSRVEGVVRALDGSPVAGATVTLNVQSRRATTDEEGRFTFENVKPGTRVQLFASKDGRLIASVFLLVSDWIERVEIRERPPLPVGGRTMSVESRNAVARGEFNPGQESAYDRDLFGDIRGVVRSADGRSLTDAALTIEDPSLSATTDAAGRFAFARLPAGQSIVLHAAAPGYEVASQEVLVSAGKPVDVNLTLKSAPDTSAETPNVPLLYARSETEAVTLRPIELTGVPALANRNLFHGLVLTPGVDSSLESTSGLGIRGGTPDQSLVTLDGITLYNVDHLFGYVSALIPESVRRADLSEATVAAADGGRLSGVVRLTGQSAASTRATGFVGGSLMDYGAFASVPFGGRGGLTVSARRSYPSALFKKTLDLYASGGAQTARGRAVTYTGGTILPALDPLYQDVTAKFEVRPTRADRLAATFFDTTNKVDHSRDFVVDAATLGNLATLGIAVPSDLVVKTSELQDWKARGYSGSWMRQWSPSFSTTLSASHSQYSEDFGRAALVASRATGVDYSTSLGRGGSNAFSETNTVKDTTVRLDSTFTFGFTHLVSLGAETKSLDIGYESNTEVVLGVRKGGGYNTGLAPLFNGTSSGRLITFYVQDTWNPTPRLVVTPGLRATYFDVTGSSYAQPRLTLSYQASSETRLRIGGSVDDQMDLRLTREDLLQGDSSFWILADGAAIPVAHAQQAFAGISYMTPAVLLDAQGYYRYLDDLSMFAPRLIPGVAPGPGAQLIHQGWGTAMGAEVVIQHKASWNSGWISYSLSKVEYTFPTLETSAFPAPQDHRHDLKVTDVVRIGPRWTIGATFMASSGRGITPAASISAVWLPAGAEVDQLSFAAKNSERLPVYHRLDISTQREFRVSGLRATLGASVFNVYNRKNVWLHDLQVFSSAPTMTDVNFLGRSFNVFARIGF
jgi:ferric enterobactin receptor